MAGKRTKKINEGVDPTKLYALDLAISMVKERAVAKFDETVEVSMNLGVDPRHADHLVSVARVDAQVERNFNGLVELRLGAFLDHLDRFVERIGLRRVDTLTNRLHALASCHGAYPFT